MSETTTNGLLSVCVFCGSEMGTKSEYREAAASLGKALAEQGRPLVYGGGSSGLMGVVSAECKKAGGKTVGIIPKAIAAGGGEGSHHVRVEEDSENIFVGSMHERKTQMARLSQGFIGLPGGYGTFEELLEATTWTQLGIHQKPVILLNVLGYYTPLRSLIDGAVSSGFVRPRFAELMGIVDAPEPGTKEAEEFDWGRAALKALDEWKMPETGGLFKWAGADTLDQT